MSTQLYEITLVGTYNNAQEVINRWNYRGDVNGVVGGDAAGLMNAMGFDATGGNFPATTLAAGIQNLCNTIISWSQVLCRNIYDPTDFIDLPFAPVVNGLSSGECLSPINAFGFRSNRTRLDIGRGYKRFPGVSEAASGGGGIIVSATKTALDAIAVQMTDTMTYTDGTLTNTYLPVVVKKLKYTTGSGKTAYKYYATLAEQLTHLAVGVTWEAYTQVRSQVSRQYGKGA